MAEKVPLVHAFPSVPRFGALVIYNAFGNLSIQDYQKGFELNFLTAVRSCFTFSFHPLGCIYVFLFRYRFYEIIILKRERRRVSGVFFFFVLYI